MWADSVCRICLVNNVTLYSVRNDLHEVYERIVKEKFNQVGYPVHMCYICMTVLRKCHRFMETAQDTNNVLKHRYHEENEVKVARPLYTYSISKVDLVSTYSCNISLQHEIKVEKVELGLDQVNSIGQDDLEWNTDVDIEKTDKDEQTNYSELLVDNDNNYTYKIEYNNDGEVGPLYNTKIEFEETSGMNDDTNEIRIKYEMIPLHDNDAPPIKKRAPDTPGDTPADSETSNDITLSNSTPSPPGVRHRNIKTKLSQKTKDNKKTFKNVTHLCEKLYSCYVCDYKCIHKGNLKRHIITHTGVKPFACSICEYKCAQRDDLKKHMITHTGEKPFSCNTCNYKCGRKGDLKKHMRTHTREKPFRCNFCKYKCARTDDLKKHMVTHTGEKPFTCDFCDYKCSRSSSLKRHLSSLHCNNKREEDGPFFLSVGPDHTYF